MRAPISNAGLQWMVLATFLALVAGSSEAQPKAVSKPVITKANVLALLASIDTAIAHGDAAGVTVHCATHAAISVTATIALHGDRYQTANDYTKDDLQDWLRIGFLAYSPAPLHRRITAIKIAADGQTARCDSTVVERCSLLGDPITVTSKESLSLALVRGKVMVTRDQETATVQ
jgi:hypothetical protein